MPLLLGSLTFNSVLASIGVHNPIPIAGTCKESIGVIPLFPVPADSLLGRAMSNGRVLAEKLGFRCAPMILH